MRALNILNKLSSILNIIIITIVMETLGIKIGLLFGGAILLGGIEGIIFSSLNRGE